MLARNREGRPVGNGPAPSSSTRLKATPVIVTPTTDILADLDVLAERLRGRFVVQVSVEGGHWRTNVYRNAAAAERAVDRATARGQHAHVTLVQMLPVGVVVGLGGER